jgi:small subunit ribosomal protein S21
VRGRAPAKALHCGGDRERRQTPAVIPGEAEKPRIRSPQSVMDETKPIPYTPGLPESIRPERVGPPTQVIRVNRKVRGFGIRMVKLTVRERESIQEAVRRFRKLVERSGIKKEMRRREFFEKPSETKRRDRLRAERRTKRNRLLGV